MLGQEIAVEYFDQNDNFKALLPRSGRIVRELSLSDWGSGWNLLELDEPFDYQHKVAEPYVFKLLHITQLLIKSRWEGFAIGAAEPTSVFVLLIPDPSIFGNENISSKDFIHVCWGMVHTNDIQQIVGRERRERAS
jgi:hypothetical protein